MKSRMGFYVGVVCLALSGCVQLPMSPHQPSMENLDLIRNAKIAPLGVGTFALAVGKPPEIDKQVTARSVTLTSPNGDSFAQFLKEAVTTELRAAGKWDPSSSVILSGKLIDNQLDASGSNVGTASLAAKFLLTRGGGAVFEKEFTVEAKWESSFVGASAIPAAINEYTTLFKKLLGRLFGDQDFREAAREK